jgi:quinol monooxygenase YgiN
MGLASTVDAEHINAGISQRVCATGGSFKHRRTAVLVLTAFVEVAAQDREAIQAALPNVIASSQAEDGCEDYGCYEDTQSPGRYVFIERWRDKASLDRHLATLHMAAWMKVAGPKMRSARGFLYEVSSSTELKPR